ncbi:hypothetical protein AB205_0111760, partial [Aquarana catesbeiana]
MEDFLLQLRATAASHGPEWLHRQITVIAEEDSPVVGTSGARRARRSRPPERFSSPSSPRAQCHLGSPRTVDPPGTPAPPSTPAAGASTGRNPQRRRRLSGSGQGAVSLLVPPARRGTWEHTARLPNVAPSRESAQRGRGCHAGTGQSVRVTGVAMSNFQDCRSLRSGGRASHVPPSSALAAGPSRRSAGSTGARRSAGAGTRTSRPVTVASSVVIPDAADQQDATFPWSEGELSSSEDERAVRAAAVETGRAAVGPLPVQPDAGAGLVWIMGTFICLLGGSKGGCTLEWPPVRSAERGRYGAVDRSSWHAVEQCATGNPQ